MAASIEEGTVVLLCKNNVYKPVTLTKGRKVVFDRISFVPDTAIGKPFGSQFQVKDHKLVPSQGVDATQYVVEVIEAENKDNRKIFDDGSSQSLTHKDIHDMKEEGISGQDIIHNVIQGSSSFKDKTSYSQAKYIRKKEKKHVPIITIVKPSTRLLCKMYYSKSPSKICHLRLDTIARILTYSNVHTGVNALVVESCQGLLLGSVLERLGGTGNVVQAFFGDRPVRTALGNFGHLSDQDKSLLMSYPLQRLANLLNQTHEASQNFVLSLEKNIDSDDQHNNDDVSVTICENVKDTDNDVCTSSDCMEVKDTCSFSPPLKKFKTSEDEMEDNDTIMEQDETTSDNEGKEIVEEVPISEEQKLKDERRQQREEEYEKAASFIQSTPMDCLIIATRFHPEPILTTLLPFVAPSRPVVVYSQFQEPLVQCYKMLRERGGMFNLQISETWLRRYQVLPGRTHPDVCMDAQSGYLLVGTTIIS